MPAAGGGTTAHIHIGPEYGACDAWNQTVAGQPGGVGPGGVGGPAQAKLYLETIYVDPTSGKYYFGSNFDAIFAAVGLNTTVQVPDLYADTNNDGTIGSGDLLYSLVDLSEYLQAIPSFSLGESFSIVNGASTGLPGMYFSSTDFVFTADPPSNGPGFEYTPVTIDAVVGTTHGLTAVPEPSSITLLAVGLAGLGLRRRRKSSILATS